MEAGRASTLPKIKGLFFAEFDNTLGPAIVYQCPAALIRSEDFEPVSEYVITKQTLSGRITCVRIKRRFPPSDEVHNDWLIGYPICLSHQKYFRNALLFNVCLVLDEDTEPKLFSVFESVVQKIARYFATLEIESEYLTSSETRPSIVPLLEKIHNDLNIYSSCILQLNENTKWHLRLEPLWDQPPEIGQIKDHHVPIPLVNLSTLIQDDWDLVVKAIYPYIDGVNYVKKIQKLAFVDAESVKKALQHLLFYNTIVLGDIFQYSNMYRVTDGIYYLAADKEMQAACVKAVTLSNVKAPPQYLLIFVLYCQLLPGITLYEFGQQHQLHNFNIDIRQLITFGVANGIIKRVHKYPLALSKEASGVEPSVAGYLHQAIDGKHSLDEISTETGLSYAEVNRLFDTSFFL